MFLWATILVGIFLKERIDRKFLFSVFILLLANSILLKKIFPQANFGNLLVFIATLLWSIENTISKYALKNLQGKNGNSLVAEYNLGDGDGQWVAFEKAFKLDFTKKKTIKFWIKADGNINRVEFKIIDEDGSIFGQRYEDLTSSWEEIKISVDELEYWWGGDDKLTKPIKIGFAISSIDGGKGKIWLDDLMLTK
jgi:hypothetical protein